MMTDKQLSEKFLQLQEQLGDEQALQEALADPQMREFAEQMAFVKRSMVYEKAQHEAPSVNEAWEQFAAKHADALDALDDEPASHDAAMPDSHPSRSPLYKMAASFIGVLLVSGIAFAAIHIVRSERVLENDEKAERTEQAEASLPTNASQPADSLMAEPYVFDNMTLEQIVSEIATAHHVTVEYQSADAQQLRFHFVWKREESLERTVEKLNTFERVSITIEHGRMIVK